MQDCRTVLKRKTMSETAAYPRITERACEDKCSPSPPVRTSRRKEVETRGVCRRGMRLCRREMVGIGRMLMRRMGARAMKAKI
jgi:hypothetical protein